MNTKLRYSLIALATAVLFAIPVYLYAESVQMCGHVPVPFTWAGTLQAFTTLGALIYLNWGESTHKRLAKALCVVFVAAAASTLLVCPENLENGHFSANEDVQGFVEF